MNTGILDYIEPHGTYYQDMQECFWLIQVEKDQSISLEILGEFYVSLQNLLLEGASLFTLIFVPFS